MENTQPEYFSIGSNGNKFGLKDCENPVEVGLDGDFFVMAGPCVIESKELCIEISARLAEIARNTGVGIIFKASFDKANRSSIKSYRGPGLHQGLDILSAVRLESGLPVMTDVHEPDQVPVVSGVVDCLQVPAFLCRQTNLLCACGRTEKPVNVKKGQFLSPEEMNNIVDKLHECNNQKIMLTERGTFFGYNRLVNDMTSIETMKALGCPVIFDATHSTQQPGGLGEATAGKREMAPILSISSKSYGGSN